jgi:uncharacterized membrane protein YcaP (DUF421 family)
MLDEALPLLRQAGLALAWYAALIGLVRLAGKRLAGQVTTFDLVVVITLGVVLQSVVLEKGTWNALVFVGVVFVTHRTLAFAMARSRGLRHLVRGKPRPLIRDGRIDHEALAEEGLSVDELRAGLRKVGHDDPEQVRLATLEETGQISVVT